MNNDDDRVRQARRRARRTALIVALAALGVYLGFIYLVGSRGG